jgi:hypothetical protein
LRATTPVRRIRTANSATDIEVVVKVAGSGRCGIRAASLPTLAGGGETREHEPATEIVERAADPGDL